MTIDELSQIEALAAEIAELSRTFEGSSQHFMVDGPPCLKKSEELVALIQSPAEHATSLIAKTMETAVIRTLLSLNVLQTIPTPGYISLQDLAAATETQPYLLERLLRVVTRSGFIIRENEAYCHTHTSLAYAGPLGGLFTPCYDEGIRALIRLPEYLSVKSKEEAKSAMHSPFTWNEGQEGKTTFEILSKMPARTKGIHTLSMNVQHLRPYAGFFDFNELVSKDPERPVFVDVGGGNGHVIKEILQAFPRIRPEQCVLEDRAETIELARTTGLLPAGVQLLEHDYLTRQPISNAKAYHLRAVAYNLGDAELVQLLKQIVPVMGPDSKVLIAENILFSDNGTTFSTVSDMIMLCIGGKERTERNFREVLDEAGLTIDSIHRASGLEFGIVEASLKMP
ncbi:S-adenosyl-L-methionine-dependent methyltransferase [Penicillium atrosanguineum]|uniref:S-adenosyl-L-methionine-dependent methyltransferase n=1 Tax=Penicillium atrosanguineum TaxID=1132637 RepID=A0A9W9GEU6_9EURO|nr:S-adenosyl-L-methionine-dependent methyltransferase [Penicillium atrosanguineum]KAJ5318484.1 S-adenosyl-L-methionine-dependent methyltransferase [Penicillium atrosanguineum]KAJ5318514.1 S-adenosyl-L-methionine-dependent methyltransferase [Penicillium atrosanguineum]